MARPASEFRTLYQQLCELAPNMVGEIVGGVLHVHPRPTARHAAAASALGGNLFLPFQRGRGGPGGWWILDEPELHVIRDQLVLVPDLGGWRRERMAKLPDDHRFEVAPDWVCEVLSPATERYDREDKMAVYARHGVAHAWLVDPARRTLEVYERTGDRWTGIASYRDDHTVIAAPFAAVPLDLATLWAD